MKRGNLSPAMNFLIYVAALGSMEYLLRNVPLWGQAIGVVAVFSAAIYEALNMK